MASRGARESKAPRGKCPYCGAAVKEENLPRHLRSVHPGRQEALDRAKDLEIEARRAKPRARGPAYGGGLLASKAFLALVIAAVIIVAGVAVYILIPQTSAPDPELTEPIAQICYGNEAIIPALHRHTLLHIFFNNQSETIPQGIGIPTSSGGLDTCWRPLHTHDATGRIHIEPRIPRSYTLGDFFDLWALNQPGRTVKLDATHILDKDTAAGGSIQIQVNGVVISSQNYRTQLLVDPSLPATSDGHIFIYYTGP